MIIALTVHVVLESVLFSIYVSFVFAVAGDKGKQPIL